jgi:hypothetical protein
LPGAARRSNAWLDGKQTKMRATSTVSATDVLTALKAKPGRYIKPDLNRARTAIVLSEADGTELLVVPRPLFDALQDERKIVLKDGKFLPV